MTSTCITSKTVKRIKKKTWATSWENVSSGVSNQVRLKLSCSAAEASNRLEILVTETRDITLSRHRTTKMLVRLRGCAGWSAPFLFAYDIRHLFSWPGSHVFSYFWYLSDIICGENDLHVKAQLETLSRSLNTSSTSEISMLNPRPNVANDISLLQQSYSTAGTSPSKNKEKTSNSTTAGSSQGDTRKTADELVIKTEPLEEEGPNKNKRYAVLIQCIVQCID